MTPLTSSTSTVLEVGLPSPNQSLIDLSSVVDWALKPSALAVPGLAKLAVFGDAA